MSDQEQVYVRNLRPSDLEAVISIGGGAPSVAGRAGASGVSVGASVWVAEPQAAAHDYKRAAHYYELYLDSFPQDPRVPDLAFLLGESLYEAGEYTAAIHAYDWLAYIYRDTDRAADAAYTAILAREKLTGLTNQGLAHTEEDLPVLMRQRIDAQLRFQATFPGDEVIEDLLRAGSHTLAAEGAG